MNEQMSARRVELLQQNEGTENRLAQLKSQLNNLAVKDETGLLLGEVKDVNLAPDGHIKLVISRIDTARGSRLFVANSQLIQKIEYATQSVFINLTAAEVEMLPDYEMPQSAEVVHSELPNRSVSEGTAANYRPTDWGSDRSPDPHHQPVSLSQPEELTEASIRLLEERLVIDRGKQKVGDVIVRKQIETRMVEVPIRREILIVEQVSPERKQLAEIDLGKGQISGIDLSEIPRSETQPLVKGEFDSPQTAIKFLEAIASHPHHGCAKVRVELVLENPLLQETYQDWLARYNSH